MPSLAQYFSMKHTGGRRGRLVVIGGFSRLCVLTGPTMYSIIFIQFCIG